MSDTICGADCAGCPFRDGCGGCRETGGRPFGRECLLAACCAGQGRDACGQCGGTCRLKSQLAAEFNALSVRDMPEVTDLNPLPGSFINLPYTLPNGQMVKLLAIRGRAGAAAPGATVWPPTRPICWCAPTARAGLTRRSSRIKSGRAGKTNNELRGEDCFSC